MKTISAALSTHLDQEVTTLCSCWKIVRKDGKQFFFTDHDQDIFFEGDTYEAESSYQRTAVSNTADFSVDNLDVTGILDSEKITDTELRAGLFNRADVYIFILNWMNPSQGALKVRRGWFGEVTLHDNNVFTTEVRGLAQALSHNFIELYTAECRADFCDARCKLNIANYTRRASVLSKGDGRTAFIGTDIPPAPTTSTSVGAHRYWSIKPTAYPSLDQFFISEVRFRDQNGNLVTGGSAEDNIPSNMKNSEKPSRLRNGNFNDAWGFASWWNEINDEEDDEDIDIENVRWWIDFGSPRDIKEVEIIATYNAAQAISAFELQYSDVEPEPGSSWSLAKECTHLFTEGGQSAVWGIGSETSVPVNVAASAQPLPAPYTGMSTYAGGTVTWLTGKNAGRTVEILGFNAATNEVSLFEAMPYTIAAGDLFNIAQGCDGSLATCKLYDNVINRRAEDYIPGNDDFMQYPDAK